MISDRELEDAYRRYSPQGQHVHREHAGWRFKALGRPDVDDLVPIYRHGKRILVERPPLGQAMTPEYVEANFTGTPVKPRSAGSGGGGKMKLEPKGRGGRFGGKGPYWRY